MALVGRMKQWREAQRQRAGGMVALTTWVPSRSAEYLKGVFARLADPSERGADYRHLASLWIRRRRAIRHSFRGTNFSAEIDLPFLGPDWYQLPAGGRVTGAAETWIELTPDEAAKVSQLCQDAVSKVLSDWLREQDLYGKLRDHTGVALGTDFAQPGYSPREGESVIRPKDEAAFETNEVHIAQEVERAALQSRKHPTDDPTVVYFPGFHGVPSRCHAVHRRVGDRVLFALGHIEYGGTSPTNDIENLTVRMWKQFYPEIPFDRIEWFDAWPEHYSLTNKFQIQRVLFSKGEKGGYAGPIWARAGDVPENFIEEVRLAITPKAPLSEAAE